ncbi:16802_t:CDS:2 [Funneliformis mosseae]|uniref:16802_t:CDS:1 n=1 Tax=Funneliformis mosseae TaxID=27381 RepID=A0A9N9DNX6_FUNMO|nr:16802_t:CDS:2 [Funneliformis mosseae]
MYGLRSYDYQIYLERCLIASGISPKEVEERAMKAKFRVKNRKYDNLVKNYGDYLKKLQAEKDLNNYIKILAVKMFPKEEAYTERLENYRKRYEDNDLYSSLEELYELYYHIAKEENHEKSDDKIEQMLRAIAI